MVVGLGNPGPKYEGTRHNVGFEVVRELADRWELGRVRETYGGLLAEGRAGPGGPRVILFQPLTFMNEAGWDRIARVAVGVALVVVGFVSVGGTTGTVLGIGGLIPLVTGLVGYCPLYALLHVRTNRRDETPTAA